MCYLDIMLQYKGLSVILAASPGMFYLCRLTFWLSNSIMLRAIVRKTVGELQLSDEPCIKSSIGKNESNGKGKSTEELDDLEDLDTFTTALEKVEAWIFSRIVESVWWQVIFWAFFTCYCFDDIDISI